MAEVEEPQFTSLAARKAALMQNGVGTGFGKRAPPPPPDKKPGMPRAQTTNNPPISTYGSSAIQKPNNQPMNAKGQALLPPPPVDRDQPTANPRTPPLPARNGPPALPARKASQPSPLLPPRKTSTQLSRRGSNDSTLSFSSTISGMSLGQSTTASSIDSGRRLPPTLAEAKLPPLPPSRRDLEEKAKSTKLPLVSTKSAPNVPLREPPLVDRDNLKTTPRPNGPPRLPSRQATVGPPTINLEPPKQPPRPTSRGSRQDDIPPVQPPKMPPRPGNRQEEEARPPQPTRRLPPPAAARSALSMGFGNKSNETPNPPPRPTPTITKQTGPAILELSASNFDRTIRGKKALVEFYGPRCWNCQQLEPHWQKLGENFSFASDRLIIAKVNMDANSSYHNRYGISKYPTILLFDGDGENYDKYEGEWNLEELTEYLERKTGSRATDGAQTKANDVPPPINLSTKPSANQSTKPRRPAASPSSGCLKCRDFSGPDGLAAQHPRHSLPRTHDITGYLADVLCSPFPSPTDKARAIFTWLHYNIAYDVDAFFGNRVKHVEPKDTIASGVAVCGGYAGVFSAIALKAGLEAVMVTGHGKGYGYNVLKPGDPIPPRDPSGHAWNAVRIDDGEWKLLDACWGAGNVGDRVYNKHFTPSYFTMSNDEFGIKHFPQDDAYFFRSDGSIPTWESYMLGPCKSEPLQVFGVAEDSGISTTSFEPPQKHIRVNTRERIRFRFHRVCEHWDHEKNGSGKPYCLILKVEGRDGRNPDFVAFESNEFWWWADVNARDLGAPGQTISVYSVTTVNEKDARGMTREQYLQKKGKPGSMGFSSICAWELV